MTEQPQAISTPPKATLDAVDESVPIPRRYWWLKRVLVVIGGLILGLAMLRLWWGWYAHRQFEAEVAKIEAAGEPIRGKDFDTPYVPEAENAIRFLEDAAAALDLSEDDTQLLRSLERGDVSFESVADQVAVIVGRNAKSLRLAREARSHDRIDWGMRFTDADDFWNMMLPGYGALAPVVYLLCGTAQLEHVAGNDREAITHLRDALTLSEAAGDRVFPMYQNIAGHYMWATARRVEEMSATLSIAGAPGSSTDARACDRRSIDELILELLDVSTAERGLLRGLKFERMSYIAAVRRVSRGEMTTFSLRVFGGASTPTLSDRALSFPLLPLVELDGVRLVRYGTGNVEAARQESYPQAAALFPPAIGRRGGLDRTTKPLSPDLTGSFVWLIRWHHECVAFRRMAAIALAIRLYVVDHGVRPATLDELVPAYLAEVPADPMAFPPKPIGYRPDASPPVLYSIGSDGVDDGGTFRLTEHNTVRSDKLDLVFFLDEGRPTSSR